MMSFSALGKAAGDKAAYYQNLACRDDYYQEGGEPPGTWLGAGTHALGLHGQRISTEALQRLFRGQDPHTGAALVQGAGANHRAGWDLTFSAPKSVTAAWAVADEAMRAKIQAAQDRAVTKAIALIEQKAAYTRRGKAGAEHERLPGLIVGAYAHSTSREQDGHLPDPQLHDHCLVLNIAQRQDGSWGTIESRHIMDWQKAAGAAYRAELAAAMREIGFMVEKDGNFFKLAGISQDLCDTWSKRRQAIEKKLEEVGGKSARAAEAAALGTRSTKGDINREELHDRWRAEAQEFGLDAEIINKLAAGVVPELPTEEKESEGEKGLGGPADIYERLTWSESVFTEQQLWERVAIDHTHEGGGGVDQVAERVANLLRDREIIKLYNDKGETYYTTRGMRQLEEKLAADAVSRQAETWHVVAAQKADAALTKFAQAKGFALSDEQQSVVHSITQNAGGVQIVRGAAGAGKSTMAEAARMAWESAGMRVLGCAPSGKAAKGLQESAGITSSTIHRLLYDLDAGRQTLDAKSIVVVDEAGMVGSRLLSRLLGAAQFAGAKVVLVGDAKQLQAVEAGGAFRMLQNRLGHQEITEVRRQRDQADKAAANSIAAGRVAEAIESYSRRGRIHISELTESERHKPGAAQAAREQAMKELVGAWRQNAFAGGDPRARIQESLIMAGTRADVHALNQLARQEMMAAGRLVNEHQVQTRNGPRTFGEGDRILLGKNKSSLGVDNGSLGWIQRLELDRKGNLQAIVRMDDGQVRRLQLNGEGAYKHIDHGYAVTTHKSQGATVDNAFVLLSQMSDVELSYVQASRQRDAVHFFASSRMIENELERAAEGREATEKMLKTAKAIADREGLTPPETTEFWTVRDWLNNHASQVIQAKGEKNEPLAGSAADIGYWVGLMSRSHQKDTSLDYTIAPESQAPSERLNSSAAHQAEEELEIM